ncbi:MAG: D-arabinose 1-dehydrogenase-like Zn-dependent alcohol dehydrogenase [Pseudomonadales bacterium]|uniref:hypothetical protein n=1 Tax=Marinobacter maritimus TaxID=277961 RepID=UPI001642A5D4|nr:hypothetical protein [Marinobacter maritimus]
MDRRILVVHRDREDITAGADVRGIIGERVLVRPMQQAPDNPSSYNLITFGSECNGGYAEYAVARSSELFAVNGTLSEAELASFPCAYSGHLTDEAKAMNRSISA